MATGSPDIMLTRGACAALLSPNTQEGYTPILQLLSVKRVNAGTVPERMRLILSDGEFFTQAMLATQLNYMLEGENNLDRNVIVRIERFVCNLVQDKRIVIVLALEVIGRPADKIGDPKSLDRLAAGSSSSANGTHAAAAPAAANANGGASRQPANGAASRSANGPLVFPIESLSPYQNKWTIKARVTNKSDIRHWSNQKGEGKLFSMTLMDETGEIRATAFNQQVDDFFDRVTEGQVYFISKGRINIAKKNFGNVQNQYEITLERNTEIEPCHDTTNVPEVKYNFVTLEGLMERPKDDTCDVIGVVTEVHGLDTITSKSTGREITKRDLTIVDRSSFSCRLTLWGKSAENFQADNQPVVAFKGVKVNDFNGRSLSALSSTLMSVNPDIQDAHLLRGWYDGVGSTVQFQSYSSSGSGSSGPAVINRNEMKTLGAVKDQNLGMGEGQDYFTSRATLVHVKQDNFAYPACPTDRCNKKLVETSDGKWECSNCNKMYDEPNYRYILTISVSDYTGQAWFTAFNEAGEQIMDMKANELQVLKDTDDAQFQGAFSNVQGKIFTFNCRAKQDNFNDQTRVRYTISRQSPLECKAETAALLDNIHKYF